MTTLINDLKWRHACKAMNGKQVPQEIVDNILEAIRLAPSSLGLQAYKVFVIENKDLRDRIYNESCPQQPVLGCSHLIVFAARTEIANPDYESYIKILKDTRGKDEEHLAKYREKIEGFVNLKVGALQPTWLVSQTYIGLGIACAAAAEAKVNSVPIEGFDREKLDQILSLKEKGYRSTLLLPLGYADEENDWWGSEKKLRKGTNDFIEVIK